MMKANKWVLLPHFSTWMVSGLLVFGAWEPSHAQSEVGVVNAGFEVFDALPSASGQIHLAPGWSGCNGVAVPDFYHLNGSNGGDLPQTPLAKVSAYEGRGIAGFVAWTDEANAHHEYLNGQFTRPLEEGVRYAMSFAITSGRVHDWVQAGIGVSGLGVSMGHGVPEQMGHTPLNLHTQFQIQQAVYNKTWKKFEFVFTATEAFTHFTLGVFDGDVRKRQDVNGDRTMAYYFVDDFQVSVVDQTLSADMAADRGTPGTPLPEGVYIPNAFTPDGDQVNDWWLPVLPEGVAWQCVVLNRWGHEVWSMSNDGMSNDGTREDGWDGKDASGRDCPAGVYVWRLVLDNPEELVGEWKGWLNVMR